MPAAHHATSAAIAHTSAAGQAAAGEGTSPDTTIGDIYDACGGPADKRQLWIAIARAESGGNVKDIGINPSPYTIDVGLWQINTGAHQDLFTTHPGNDLKKVKLDPLYNDPYANGRAAKSVSNNWQNTQPWSSMHNGAAQKFNHSDNDIKLTNFTTTGGADAATGTSTPSTLTQGINAIGDTASTVAGGLGDLVSLLGMLFDPSTWYRIGKVLIGGLLLLLIAYMALKKAA